VWIVAPFQELVWTSTPQDSNSAQKHVHWEIQRNMNSENPDRLSKEDKTDENHC